MQSDTKLLPLLDTPDEHRRLADCRVAPYDGSEAADWVIRAHTAWLAFAAQKLRDLPGREEAMLDALFSGSREYGQELLTPALALADGRALTTPD